VLAPKEKDRRLRSQHTAKRKREKEGGSQRKASWPMWLFNNPYDQKHLTRREERERSQEDRAMVVVDRESFESGRRKKKAFRGKERKNATKGS